MGRKGWVLAVVTLAAVSAACGSTSTQVGGASTTGATTSTSVASTTAASTAPTTATTTTTLVTVPGQATTVVADCGSGAYQPARIVVTCGNGAVVATEIHWSQWTVSQASGTSVVQVNTCQPSCAAQSAKPFNGRVALSDPVGTSHGPRFAHLTITWTGPLPYGQASNSYSLTTST